SDERRDRVTLVVRESDVVAHVAASIESRLPIEDVEQISVERKRDPPELLEFHLVLEVDVEAIPRSDVPVPDFRVWIGERRELTVLRADGVVGVDLTAVVVIRNAESRRPEIAPGLRIRAVQLDGVRRVEAAVVSIDAIALGALVSAGAISAPRTVRTL